MKLQLKEVTQIIVDCVDSQRAERILEYNKNLAEFATSRLLTSKPSSYPQKVTIPHIGSVNQYSYFVIKRLLDFFDSRFVLMVQHDGFIVNPAEWTEDNLKYDYIGAPWPDKWLWHGFDKKYNVGNGGFSLRSRKLQLALEDPHIKVSGPEDVMICQKYRPFLEEKYQILFAPKEVAQRFSKEWKFDGKPSFGQHARGKPKM